ncbi:MAG TPA: glycosyltransferase [Albitalea sp.]|uniref:glycosyltransferase n=1 Tax=Piscinibacter sp. TaxID=1903157 RepID=UPI002ED5B30B
MKVLQLCKFYSPVSGGMESVALELTEGLARRGFEMEVLCANTSMRTEIDACNGYTVTRAASLGRLLSMSVTPALLAHAGMVRRADIVHVHMPDPMTALALWLARPCGKVVVHWHSDVVRQRFALQMYRPLQHWLLRRADALIATSRAYAEASPWLRGWRKKITVIPIGISDPSRPGDEAGAARLRERFGGRRIVFSLGRMTYYKGFDVLIDAAAMLQDDCVIIAGGEGELLLRHRDEVVRRGLAHKVAFVGPIPHDEIGAYFRAASVFCLASTQRAEAYGVVLVEAMAMGVPVVATDIPGSAVPWVNQSGVTGLTVPVGDAAALANAINAIVADDAYAARLGQAARKRYLQCLHAEAMVRETEQLYRRLMASDGTRHGQERFLGAG